MVDYHLHNINSHDNRVILTLSAMILMHQPIIIMLEKVKDLLHSLTNFADIPLFVLRLSIGLMFAVTGWGKLHNLSDIEAFFTSLHIPFPGLNAIMVANFEFFGGILIILGLFTRLISIPLAGIMAVALLTAHLSDITNIVKLVNEPVWYYLLIYTLFICVGPGRISLDYLICKDCIKKG